MPAQGRMRAGLVKSQRSPLPPYLVDMVGVGWTKGGKQTGESPQIAAVGSKVEQVPTLKRRSRRQKAWRVGPTSRYSCRSRSPQGENKRRQGQVQA